MTTMSQRLADFPHEERRNVNPIPKGTAEIKVYEYQGQQRASLLLRNGLWLDMGYVNDHILQDMTTNPQNYATITTYNGIVSNLYKKVMQ